MKMLSDVNIYYFSDTWVTKMKLSDSIEKTTLLYGVQVLSIQYLEKIEPMQTKFLKLWSSSAKI